jgi:hypothetical protein
MSTSTTFWIKKVSSKHSPYPAQRLIQIAPHKLFQVKKKNHVDLIELNSLPMQILEDSLSLAPLEVEEEEYFREKGSLTAQLAY